MRKQLGGKARFVWEPVSGQGWQCKVKSFLLPRVKAAYR